MIKFGPSGNSNSFYQQGFKRTFDAPKWIAEKGLNAFEYSFGLGVKMSDETALQINSECAKHGVEISVHAPYYVNLANPSDESAETSYQHIIKSCKKLEVLGGKRVIFHPASLGKMTRDDAVLLTFDRFKILRDKIYENGLQNYYFCPEVMGKINQIGTVEEVAKFCTTDKCFIPCIDFGHLNARTYGSLKTPADFEKVILTLLDVLGYEKTSAMHVHFSKIEYSKGGEVRHLTFSDKTYGPEFEPLAEVLVKHNLNPVIICESDGTQAEDSLQMKNIYYKLKEQQ